MKYTFSSMVVGPLAMVLVAGCGGSPEDEVRPGELAGGLSAQVCWICENDPLAPVCGLDGKSYDNVCYASCEGIEVWYEGACLDCKCPIENEPVCGDDGATYGSPCLAECAGVKVVHPGRCGDVITPRFPVTFASHVCWICELDPQAPVCGLDGKTYGNPCYSSCEGVDVWYEGSCLDCKCPIEDEPVCGDDGTTYGSGCLAECVGVKVVHPGPCGPVITPGVLGAKAEPPCKCEDPYKPVCGVDGKTYDNKCEAVECAGVEVAHEGACRCNCPEVIWPVCGADGQTYNNECLATCRGVEVVHEGPCWQSADPE
jgi:hypothetical protein